MSFLTKPTVTKGEPSSFTLVKSQLILIPKVSSDTFFADTTNWQKVSVQFKNAQGQEEVLVFDGAESSPTASFDVTEKARADYEITRIIIKDLDDGTLVIKRSDLSTEVLAMLDVSFQAVLQTIYGTWLDTNNAGLTFNDVGGVIFGDTISLAELGNFYAPLTYASINIKVLKAASGRIYIDPYVTDNGDGSYTRLNGGAGGDQWRIISNPSTLTLDAPWNGGEIIRATFEGSTNLILSIEEAPDQPYRHIAITRNAGETFATLYINGLARAVLNNVSPFVIIARSGNPIDGQFFEILQTEVNNLLGQ